MTKKKMGRPSPVMGKREKVGVVITLKQGTINKLMKKFGTEKKSGAIREAIYEVLGLEDTPRINVDSNSTRQRAKES